MKHPQRRQSDQTEPFMLVIASLAFAVGVLVWCLPALAQAVAPLIEGDTPVPWWAQALLAALGLCGSYLLTLIRTYTEAKAGELAARTKIAAISTIHDAAFNIVTDLFNTTIKGLKDVSADGVWTQAEKTEQNQERQKRRKSKDYA